MTLEDKIYHILMFEGSEHDPNKAIAIRLINEIIKPLTEKAFEAGQESVECYGGRITQTYNQWQEANLK